jgi:hypothetical protein
VDFKPEFPLSKVLRDYFKEFACALTQTRCIIEKVDNRLCHGLRVFDYGFLAGLQIIKQVFFNEIEAFYRCRVCWRLGDFDSIYGIPDGGSGSLAVQHL